MNRYSRLGFTLLEMILVVFILSILTAMALPNFQHHYEQVQCQTTASHLAQLMRYAQSEALVTNQPIKLEFFSNFSRYAFAFDVSKNQEVQKLPSLLARSVSLPEHFQVTAPALIHFYPDGSIDKKQILMCYQKYCFTISTEEQRGKVILYEASPS